MMKEAVFAQAVLLAGQLEEKQRELLRVLCSAAVSMLAARLREGITPESCREEFVLAASLYALADLNRVDGVVIQEFRAGDLTVKQGSGTGEAVSRCCQRQAEAILGPYLRDRFAFLEV